jgi:hypothetical protein
MNFRQLVNTKDFYFEMADPRLLKAQYNPERFHLWKSLHIGPEEEALNMLFSPHYRFLKNKKDDSYYNLQKYYGRNKQWIKNKIEKFLGVYENIKKNGFTENISALEHPLVKNNYNKGFEIFEGHHRVSIALILNINEIPCEIIRRQIA